MLPYCRGTLCVLENVGTRQIHVLATYTYQSDHLGRPATLLLRPDPVSRSLPRAPVDPADLSLKRSSIPQKVPDNNLVYSRSAMKIVFVR
jgi:hypothetical protein